MLEGWRATTVGETVSIASGQVDPKDEITAELISVGPDNLISGGGIDRNGLKTAKELGQISGKYVFDRDAILYSKIRPNLNKAAIPDFDGICSADMYPIWVSDPQRADREFIYYVLTSERFVAAATSRSFRTGLPKINREDLKSIEFTIPPLVEQRKIAEILRTWDEAVDKLEALRAANEDRYKVLARRFFAPCHPTFFGRPNAWREFELGDAFRERSQSGKENDRLLSITMNAGVIDRDDVGRKDTSNGDKSKYKLILPGDIGYNTMRMWQGVSGLSALRGIISPAYTVVTPAPNRVIGRYAAHLFKSRRMVFDFERYSQGLTSDTWNLKFPAFSKIKVFVPPIKDQEKHADLLDTLTAENSVIGKQLEALTRQKRGLMQKLLTGEWRAKVEAN